MDALIEQMEAMAAYIKFVEAAIEHCREKDTEILLGSLNTFDEWKDAQ